MKESHERQSADEIHPLKPADIDAVSGGSFAVDMGPLGIFTFTGECVKYTLVSDGGKSWVTFKEC